MKRRKMLNPPDGTPIKIAILLDLETTGLDPAEDEILELGMVAFTYSRDGRPFEVIDSFEGFRQPRLPIPSQVTALTGITDAMVAGHDLDETSVRAFVQPAALVIAHNAAFDRRFAERFCAEFAAKPWACSMSQIPWQEEGFDGTKLKYLLMSTGTFFEGHRAIDDCYAALDILARRLPKSGTLALASLLEEARKPTVRVCAEGAPFEFKDTLKARGYRWNDGIDGAPRAWWKEVSDGEVSIEVEFLKSKIFRGDVNIPTKRITAYDRFSDRAGSL